MKKGKQKPYAAAGRFAVTAGAICLILCIFIKADLASKLRAASAGLILLGWGMRQLQASKKKEKRESDDATKKVDASPRPS
jgi:hypothetical protein